MTTAIKYPDVQVNLSYEDGNAFVIINRCRTALRRHYIERGLSGLEEATNAFIKEATAGDYNHLLATCFKWFDIA